MLGLLGRAGLLQSWYTALLGAKMGGVAAVQGLGSLLLNQVPALLLAWLIGRHLLRGAARLLNTKRAIIFALAIYAAITVWGYFMALPVEFWMLAWMVGLVQGAARRSAGRSTPTWCRGAARPSSLASSASANSPAPPAPFSLAWWAR